MALKAYSLARDGALHLTPHFRVREFACRDGADLVKIDTDLVELLERIRTAACGGVSGGHYQRVPHRRPQRFYPRRFAPQPASVRAGR